MQALIKSKLILALLTMILLAGAITVPLSSSLFHSHAASASSQASWSVVPSPNAGTSQDYLGSVTGLSASDIWTVGYSFDGTTYQTLIEHWDGTSWSIVPSPNLGAINSLDGVEALSASNVWAVGRYSNSNSGGTGQTLIEHWDGTSWSVVPSPNNGPYGNSLLGVAAISANDIWATGDYALNSAGPTRTLIEHWDGTSWSVVPSLDPGSYSDSLGGVVALSTSDVWTVGEEISTSSPEQALIEHWDGASWSIVPSPTPAESSFSQLRGVTAVSSSDVWAVGAYADSHSNCAGACQTLIEHWDGTSWSVVPSPNAGTSSNVLTSVTSISASDIWAVGCFSDDTTCQTLIEHWDGASWSVVSNPNPGTGNTVLRGVIALSTNNAWAVGNYALSGYQPSQTLIEHYYPPSPTSQHIEPSPDPYTNSTSSPVPKKLNMKIRVKQELLAAPALGQLGQAIAVASLHKVDPEYKN